MDVAFLLKFLTCASEKAASLARKIRSEEKLFSLLIQEKDESDKNQRFAVDFKTLADVLIQETLRYDLQMKIPEVADRLFGEESNKFTNVLGESITVDVKTNRDETTALLGRVLNGDSCAANILSELVHTDVFDFTVVETVDRLALKDHTVDLRNVAFWIDPIDSTAEYISGSPTDKKADPESGIISGGLGNVTVLIGAFFVDDGLPFLGCVNQPFAKELERDENIFSWEGNLIWGVNLESLKLTNLPDASESSASSRPIRIISSFTEIDDLSSVLESPQFNIVSAPGAGYKLFCVIEDIVDAYVLHKPNTFQWDSCGPHAILLALGGGVLRLTDLLSEDVDEAEMDNLADRQITYTTITQQDLDSHSNQKWCHSQGLLAYKSESVMRTIVKTMKSKH